MKDWFDEELAALQEQLENGEITLNEFNVYVHELRQDLEEQEYREDMISAGRGHLLK